MRQQQEVVKRIRDKLLEKAREDAKRIIEDAKHEAERIIREAEEKWKKKVEETKKKILEDAERKAEEILIDAQIKARMKITDEKNKIIELLMNKIEELIEKGTYDRSESLRKLAIEAIGQLELKEVIIYVSRNDKELMEKLKSSIENELNVRINDIKEANIRGGVIVESIDGGIRIDNSYDARLEIIKTRLLPQISKELFSGEEKH